MKINEAYTRIFDPMQLTPEQCKLIIDRASKDTKIISDMTIIPDPPKLKKADYDKLHALGLKTVYYAREKKD
jgi:hypothetical protein